MERPYLVARQGADQACCRASIYMWGEAPGLAGRSNDELRWYVFDDRQMYRPGEEVHVKGWLRRIGGKQDGDVGLVGETVTGVSYQVSRPAGQRPGQWTGAGECPGRFDLAFTLPENSQPGLCPADPDCRGQPGGH